METSRNVCGPQLFTSEMPLDEWDLDQLGDFAAGEHHAIIAEETSLAPRYWRLGKALNLARKQVRHGRWAKFLDSYGIDKTRASKSRAIHRTFENEQELEGLTVEEAYARRERPKGSKSDSSDPDALEKMGLFLHNLGDCVDEAVLEAEWNPPEAITELLADVNLAISHLDRLRDVLQSRVAESI